MNAGPCPARTDSSAAAAASRTAHTSLPSTVWLGISITSARACTPPAVTSSERVYSP